MKLLPLEVTDEELTAFVDNWVSLLERADYQAAYDFTGHDDEGGWTPDLIRQVIQSYGEAQPNQKVTLLGVPTDIMQRKEVSRWTKDLRGRCGEIWYDLNIDGRVSDLTATFSIEQREDATVVSLNDIHVM